MQDKYKKNVEKLKELQVKEHDIIMKHMPKFDRGIIEAALEREIAVWNEMKVVIAKHNLTQSVNIRIKSDNQPSNDPHRPSLVCAGVEVNISYIVPPMDKAGKDGRLPEDVIEKIGAIRKDMADLHKELDGEEEEKLNGE